jgi:hypothetical protein
MSLIRFTHTNSITVDAPCARSWAAPLTGNAGQATVTLPYGNPAADSRYIDMMGGSRVFVFDEYGSGTWSGIVTKVDRDDTSLKMSAVQDHAILGRLPVSLDTTMTHTSPAAVMYAALTNAGEVLGLHTINGPWDGFQPFIEAYAMARKDVQAITDDMMNLSDGELHVDTESGAMVFCGPHAYTSLYPTVLRGNANLRDWKVPVSHWDVRERQYVKVHIPRRGGIPAVMYVCRVLARAVDSGSLLMTLTLLIVDAIPTRPRLRPLRPTKALGRGTGSVAQRLTALSRERAA